VVGFGSNYLITKLPNYQMGIPSALIPRSKGLNSTIPAHTCVAQPPSAVVISFPGSQKPAAFIWPATNY
jgi:hypothetical protein